MRMMAIALAAAACLVMVGTAIADEAACDPGCGSTVSNCCQCGCKAPCKKVCRVVCEMKKVEVTCWEVKCEDFCAPLPACGRSCGESGCGTESSCGGCDPCKDGCCCEKCVKPPKCGKVRCKKTLVKKTVTKEVPVYKCVVDYVCCDCCGSGCSTTEPAAPAPPKAKSAQTDSPAAPVPLTSLHGY
jgi:hypothetical protein